MARDKFPRRQRQNEFVGFSGSVRSCEGKRRFGSEKAALKWQRRSPNPYIVAYRCSYCGGYHLGHVPGSKSNWEHRDG